MYSLPTALSLLSTPQPKALFKKHVKSAVTNFWEMKLRGETSKLSSLKYFKPEFYSLTTPHPIWTTAGTNPYEVEKAVVQARLLSGRYRCEKLRRHWSENKSGYCELEPCYSNCKVGSIEHMLLECCALSPSRVGVLDMWNRNLANNQNIARLFYHYLVIDSSKTVQFLLDPSTLPLVIQMHQSHGSEVMKTIFYLTRTYCFSKQD